MMFLIRLHMHMTNLLHPLAGGAVLLLTALDKGRTAAIAASLVLASVLLDGSELFKLDSRTCSSLLQMGVIERLSQLLHPMLGKGVSDEAQHIGESSMAACTIHLMVIQLVLHVEEVLCSRCSHVTMHMLQLERMVSSCLCVTAAIWFTVHSCIAYRHLQGLH